MVPLANRQWGAQDHHDCGTRAKAADRTVAAGYHRQSSGGRRATRSLTSRRRKRQTTPFRQPPALATAVDYESEVPEPAAGPGLDAEEEIGLLPPRSLAAEANDCFMVWIPRGSNRIQGRSATLPLTKADSPSVRLMLEGPEH